MIATSFFSLLLLGLSGVMLDMHWRSWRRAKQDSAISASDRRYALSQYRRRTLASGIIGILGAAIGVGPLVPHRPWPVASYLALIGAACLAITVLAALDAWATRQHFAQLRSQYLAAQAKLARELRREIAEEVAEPSRK